MSSDPIFRGGQQMRNEAILVVDDEEGILIMLENLLRKEGYVHITKAGSAVEALMAARTTRFDMIVLDVMLPDMDGFSLCMELRKTIKTPILFLTARSSDLDKLQGLYLGGDDYVTKPFNPMEVIARIQAHLRRHRSCWACLGPLRFSIITGGRGAAINAVIRSTLPEQPVWMKIRNVDGER